MKKYIFNIQGMTCSSCVAHVEKAVKKLDGIKKVNVNLLSNSMVAQFDEKVLTTQQIIDTVIEAGYSAKVQDKKMDNSDNIKVMKKRLILSIIFLIPLMYLSMKNMYLIMQFILLVPIIYINRNYFIVGFKRLFKRTPNMDSLIAIGSTAAIISLYFESAGMILTLITVGKYLETKAKGKTSEAISKLINLAPKTAIVLKDGNEIEVEVDKILVGDTIIIKPGTSIPLDGEIVEGNSSVDESAITGESIPVSKNIGEAVISGTINKNGYLKVKVTKIGEDTTLAQIIKLVEEASNSKAPISRLADKVSGVFVPIVIAIAILSTIFWIIQGQSFEFAISIGIAVLVISCPCALGLATPVAIMVGTGKGAENGILIKSAESLELLHSINTVVLDKTGTITEGKPYVTNVKSLIDEKELIQIAASLEKKSEHPLGEAVVEYAKDHNIELKDAESFIAVSGRGVKGKIKGKEYFGGNIAFMKENEIDIDNFDVKEFLEQGKTVLFFAENTKIIGVIAVADIVKSTSKKAIQELIKRNIDVVMLTGDNKVVSEAIGKEIGVKNIISEVLPQDKEKEISKLQQNKKKVAFVGDGINDSPALVRADVGLAIGSGTDIAIESADIILMKNSLLDVVNAIDLSKAVMANIKMNLFWAFFYNAIGIPIAAGVFYLSLGWQLNPMIGAAAMSLSSVCVVTNALRLRNFKGIEIGCKGTCKIENIEKERKNMKTIFIEGMACNHCKMSIEKALNSIEGVSNVEVSLEEKNAKIELSMEVSNEKLKEVIEEAGFKVVSIN